MKIKKIFSLITMIAMIVLGTLITLATPKMTSNTIRPPTADAMVDSGTGQTMATNVNFRTISITVPTTDAMTLITVTAALENRVWITTTNAVRFAIADAEYLVFRPTANYNGKIADALTNAQYAGLQKTDGLGIDTNAGRTPNPVLRALTVTDGLIGTGEMADADFACLTV